MTDVALMTKEDFRQLAAEMHSTNVMLKLLLQKTTMPRTVTVSDIARMEGLSVTNINERKPWILPNFGVSDYEGGKRKWDIETYSKWSAIPEKERIEMFRTHQRNRIEG